MDAINYTDFEMMSPVESNTQCGDLQELKTPNKKVPKKPIAKTVNGADRACVYAILLLTHLRSNPGANKTTELLASCGIKSEYGIKILRRMEKHGMVHRSRLGYQIGRHTPIAVDEVRQMCGLSVFRATMI